VDLIVIGSHGYDALDRLLGTTAAKVVNHADRSVLVVRAAERILDSTP
jgi:nucleotide-binding universal stress UspA family protein